MPAFTSDLATLSAVLVRKHPSASTASAAAKGEQLQLLLLATKTTGAESPAP